MRNPFPELKIRVGPYSLFRLTPGGQRLVCRVCRLRVRRDVGAALNHRATELRKHPEGELKAILQARIKTERSLKRRAEVQYRYAENPEHQGGDDDESGEALP